MEQCSCHRRMGRPFFILSPPTLNRNNVLYGLSSSHSKGPGVLGDFVLQVNFTVLLF